MQPHRTLLAALVLILSSGSAWADSWKKDWTFYWPETVGVHFEDNAHHEWTAKEKRRALRAMDGYLWSRTKKPSTPGRRMLWHEERCGTQRVAVIEKPSELVEVTSPSRAQVIVRVKPLEGAGQTTLPTAGLPVTTTISPAAFRDYVWILDHEAQHLGGDVHGPAPHHHGPGVAPERPGREGGVFRRLAGKLFA